MRRHVLPDFSSWLRVFLFLIRLLSVLSDVLISFNRSVRRLQYKKVRYYSLILFAYSASIHHEHGHILGSQILRCIVIIPYHNDINHCIRPPIGRRPVGYVIK